MKKIELAKQPKSFFLKVKCAGCGNEQTLFSNASIRVNCLGCNQVLAGSGPGKIFLKSKVIKSF